MPLNVRHWRNGEPIQYKYSEFHLSAMLNVTEAEGTTKELWANGRVKVKGHHDFAGKNEGEVMTFEPGDEIEAFRTF